MIFINKNEIFLQNNGFDFVLFLVTCFYCTLRMLKITFPESGHSYLKVDRNETFIILLIAIQYQFYQCHIVTILSSFLMARNVQLTTVCLDREISSNV